MPISLNDQVKHTEMFWPTPTKSDYKCCGPTIIRKDGKNREKDRLDYAVAGSTGKQTGQLNADWVEILMGFPIGWTDIDCDEPQEWSGWPAPLAITGMTRTPQAHNGAQGPKSKEFYERCLETNESSITLTDQCRHSQTGQYLYEPPRVITGQKNRAKRLKCCGNTVVPQQIYPIFAAIVEVERMISDG